MKDINEFRKIYDREHRYAGEFPGYQRSVFPTLVRLVSAEEREGFIIYTKLDEGNAERVIQEQIDFYNGLGFDFEWKYFSHDTPSDLKNRLARHGFEIDEDEAIMVLDIEDAPELLTRPVNHDVRRVTEMAAVKQVRAVLEQVYNDDYAWVESMLSDSLTRIPDHVSAYLAFAGDQPIAAGWSFYNPPSPFVGLYGGATLEAYRARGVYTALVAARLHEAQQRGYRYMTVDAGPMSRPILEKLGFVCIAISNPCNFTVKKTAKG